MKKGLGPAMLTEIAIERGSARPLYRQIYEGYREAILERRLRSGQRLPSTRELAIELGISRLPVLNAFDQLTAEGYCESRAGSGTFVAAILPDDTPATRRVRVRLAAGLPGPRQVGRSAADLLSSSPEPWLGGYGPFRLSEPAVDQFPIAVWSRLVARHSHGVRRSEMLYGSPMGSPPLRSAIAAYLRAARAVRCEAEQIMVVSGSQQALAIAARVLIDPGQPVWIEEPGYAGARSAFAMAGARLVPVPVDEDGLDVAAGIQLSPRARAVYVTPSHQYPLGFTMSATRRLKLLEWAQATGAWLIEDDYDSEYRYESQPIAALQGLDRDQRVIYIGTFSKVLFPALRIAYVVIPPDLVDRFAAVRRAMDDCPPSLNPAVLADFISEGHFGRHLRKTRALYAERRTALLAALRAELGGLLRVVGSEAGMHLTALLGGDLQGMQGVRDGVVAARAARDGLWTMPLSACYLGAPDRQGLVLGYGGTTVTQIPGAVQRLRQALGVT